MLRAAWAMALNVLLPPACAACGEATAGHGLLCVGCFGATGFITDPVCDRCGRGLETGDPGPCADCVALPPVFGRARAAMRYDEAAKRLILPFKHMDRVEIADVLAPMMFRAGRELIEACDLLVPVPLHAARLRRRRYNQSALLAVSLGRLAGRRVARDALDRTRATPLLGPLPGAARRQVMAGVIAARPGLALEGRRVVLVDDVMTTCSTADACARALLGAGAASVDVVLAARVGGEERSAG